MSRSPYLGLWDRLLAMSTPVDGGYETECWAWLGNKNADDYGRLSVWRHGSYRKLLAHRVSYEEFVGPIPPGHDIDHKCQNEWCIKPDHLQAEPMKKNRGEYVQSRKRGRDEERSSASRRQVEDRLLQENEPVRRPQSEVPA